MGNLESAPAPSLPYVDVVYLARLLELHAPRSAPVADIERHRLVRLRRLYLGVVDRSRDKWSMSSASVPVTPGLALRSASRGIDHQDGCRKELQALSPDGVPARRDMLRLYLSLTLRVCVRDLSARAQQPPPDRARLPPASRAWGVGRHTSGAANAIQSAWPRSEPVPEKEGVCTPAKEQPMSPQCH